MTEAGFFGSGMTNSPEISIDAGHITSRSISLKQHDGTVDRIMVP
jgi:hypothetical protein